MCRGGNGGTPTCVILSAVDGKIIATLPLAGSSDGAAFNPRTMEAFSSHGNGTLSVIKENSPTEFVLEETVQTKAGGKTCTLDAKTDHVIVITREAAPAAPETPSGEAPDAPKEAAAPGPQGAVRDAVARAAAAARSGRYVYWSMSFSIEKAPRRERVPSCQ